MVTLLRENLLLSFSLAYGLCVYLDLFALPLVSLLYSVFVTTCSLGYLYYIITSMARTRMARLPWMIRTIFQSLQNPSKSSRKQTFMDFFLFYHGIVCCVYSLESPHRRDSNYVHSTYNHCVENRKDYPKLSLFAS